MNALEVGKKLVELCNQGKNVVAMDTLYSVDVVSVENRDMGTGRESQGLQAILGKGKWWTDNNEVHSAKSEGPYPHGHDRFIVRFTYDTTFKPTGKRNTMDEMGLFTVANGKIVREEFFYVP